MVEDIGRMLNGLIDAIETQRETLGPRTRCNCNASSLSATGTASGLPATGYWLSARTTSLRTIGYWLLATG